MDDGDDEYFHVSPKIPDRVPIKEVVLETEMAVKLVSIEIPGKLNGKSESPNFPHKTGCIVTERPTIPLRVILPFLVRTKNYLWFSNIHENSELSSNQVSK